MPADTLIERLMNKEFESLRTDVNQVVQKKIAQRVAKKMVDVRKAVNEAAAAKPVK